MTGCWLPALESLQLTYGGKVYPNRPDQNKQKYWWGVWSAEEQLAFLRTIEPHSIEKREQLLTFIKAREGIISPDVAGEQLRAMKRHVFPLEGGDGDR